VQTKHQLQAALDQGAFTRALSQLKTYNFTKGDDVTASYLWAGRQDPELTAALLLEASLFPRMDSSRRTYPRENWPPRKEVRDVRASIHYLIRQRLDYFDGWPHQCTEVLPTGNEDCWYKIEDCSGLWRFLAEEHARLYSQFRLLRINFVEEEYKQAISSVPNR
jgi:hypothetical protein